MPRKKASASPDLQRTGDVAAPCDPPSLGASLTGAPAVAVSSAAGALGSPDPTGDRVFYLKIPRDLHARAGFARDRMAAALRIRNLSLNDAIVRLLESALDDDERVLLPPHVPSVREPHALHRDTKPANAPLPHDKKTSDEDAPPTSPPTSFDETAGPLFEEGGSAA